MIPVNFERLRLDRLRQCQHLEIFDVETVLAVAETGSFRRAGQLLGIGQSAVTRRIQKLEDALGVSVFERSPVGARLTVAGWNFATRSRELANEFLNTVRTARFAGTGCNGCLRVGLIAVLSRGAPREVVEAFLAQHSDIELSFTEGDRGELMTLLSHRMIDAVIAAGEPPSVHGDMVLLSNEQLYIAVASDHPLAEKHYLRWPDVESMLFIVGAEEPGPEIYEYIVRKISDLGRHANVREQRVERETLMNLVGLRLGVSLVCDLWCDVDYPNVTFVPLREEEKWEMIPVSLTWRPESDNPALRRFLSLAREVAKTRVTFSGPS